MGKNTVNGSSTAKIDPSTGQPQQQMVVPRGSVRQKIAMFENKLHDPNFATEEQYDLTPVLKSPSVRGKSITSPPAFAVDPFEFSPGKDDCGEGEEHPLSPTR
jgi:hypothetical protein